MLFGLVFWNYGFGIDFQYEFVAWGKSDSVIWNVVYIWYLIAYQTLLFLAKPSTRFHFCLLGPETTFTSGVLEMEINFISIH